MPPLPLFPDEASTVAQPVDLLFLFMASVSAGIVMLIAGLIIYFVVKYRRKSEDEIPEQTPGSTKLEVAWTIIPAGLAMIPFVWGAWLYLQTAQPPADSIQIYVVAKQWMWKFEHPDGQEEIDELHVPIGRNIELSMISQDVIHSMFVPAFRVKQDVLPARYTTIWFKGTTTGRFHLFCTQYCGTNHSEMTGWVYMMTPPDYEAWLAGGSTASQSPAALGAKLFQQYGCSGCHHSDGHGPGPSLIGVFGHQVQVNNGQTVLADENYIHESIVDPSAKIVAGFQNIMPSFRGRLTEEQILLLIAYIKALSSQSPSGAGGGLAPVNAPTVIITTTVTSLPGPTAASTATAP